MTVIFPACNTVCNVYYAKVIQQPVTFFCMSLDTAPNFDWISSDSFYLLNFFRFFLFVKFLFCFVFFLVITSSIAVSISQFFQNCQRRQILLSFASCVGKVLIYSHYLEQTELFVIFFLNFWLLVYLDSSPCSSSWCLCHVLVPLWLPSLQKSIS